jgi:hypothetical protein
MTRSDFQAAGFLYQPPTGDQLRWRMEDVRVYCYAQPPADTQPLYALWTVGEGSYLLSTAADVNDARALRQRLPMRDAASLRRAVDAFFEAHTCL